MPSSCSHSERVAMISLRPLTGGHAFRATRNGVVVEGWCPGTEQDAWDAALEDLAEAEAEARDA